METTAPSANRPPVRLAIMGLGRAAFSTHIPAIRQLEGMYRITAVCDTLKERRDIVEAEFKNVHTYRRADDMLDDPEIDAVLVTLPSSEHHSAAMDSLRHDKWTVLESPICVTHDDAKVLHAASVRARNKLFAFTPGLFSPEFRLARHEVEDKRLGEVFEVKIRIQDYVRRDDWQSVKRCLGGCVWYEGQDAVLQALSLLRSPPAQLWSELKRVAALGDSEDFARIILKSRTDLTVDIEICGGQLPPFEPAFTIRGSRGSFTVERGATSGKLRVIDPTYKLPRRRSSVRTPDLADLHENLPLKDLAVNFPKDAVVEPAPVAFWRRLYATIRMANPFPVSQEDVVESIRYLQLVKRSSPFAN